MFQLNPDYVIGFFRPDGRSEACPVLTGSVQSQENLAVWRF
jgi:hypothetical protein